MFSDTFIRALFASTALASACMGAPALSQTSAPAMPGPPAFSSIDENGVDLSSGRLNISQVFASIGPAERALQQIYLGTWDRDNLTGTMSSTTAYISQTNYSYFKVSTGSSSHTFLRPVGSTGLIGCINCEGQTLTFDSTAQTYTYTEQDGTVTIFAKALSTVLANEGLAALRTSPNGEVLTYSYKSCGASCNQLQSIASNRGFMIKYEYSAANALSKVTALNTAIDYCDSVADICTFSKTWPSTAIVRAPDGSGSFTATDALSRTTSYTLTAGKITKIQSPSGIQKIITYDSSGRVGTVSNGTNVWTYDYTAGTARTDPLGGIEKVYTDTATGRVSSVYDELNRKVVAYDLNPSTGAILGQHSQEGNYTSFTRDPQNRVTNAQTVAKPGSGLADITTSATFDAGCPNAKTCRQPNTTTDALGNVTNYAYDSTHGGVLTVTAPAPTVGGVRPQTRYSYSQIPTYAKNSVGALVQVGAIWMQTGISACATTASCAGTADEVKTTTSYAGSNNLLPTAVTTQSGDGVLSATISTTYDDLGNAVTVDGPLPGAVDVVRKRYNAGGELIGVVGPDPDGAGPRKNRAQRLTYNSDGQVTLAEQGTVNSQSDLDWAGFAPAAQSASNYDSKGRKVADIVSAGGATFGVTQYIYDTLDRLDCTVARMNPTTWGAPLSVCTATLTSGPNGYDRITRNTYNAASELTKVTSAYGTPDVVDDNVATYNDNGTLASLTDARGNKTIYTYDGFDRLLRTTYPTITAGSGTSSTTDYEQLTYDGGGNVTSRRLRDGQTIAYAYDNLNRVATKTVPSGVYFENNVTYGYDLLGRMTSAGSVTPLSVGYDALGRKTSESSNGLTKTMQYDAVGHLIRLTWPDAFYVNYDYDVTGNVTAIRENGATSGVGVLATYAYDDLGQRASITRGNGSVTNYGFDAVSRLTSLGLNLAGTVKDQNFGFTYNPASQIASTTRSNDAYAWTGAVTVNRPYTANGLNQYSAAGSISFGYDGRGNLTSSGTTNYSYTSENRLATITNPPNGLGGVTIGYDLIGRLFQVTQGSNVTRFDHLGPQMITEMTAANTVTRRYVPGPGADEPVVWYEGSGTSDRRWLMADERGSVVAVTDGSGSSIAANSYDEYGIPGSGNAGRFQYTGQAWLPEIGMYYYKARMYSPSLGRFMQPDPIGYGDGMNWYSYVGGDPINGTDPSGLCNKGLDLFFSHSVYNNGDYNDEKSYKIPIGQICFDDFRPNEFLAGQGFGIITPGGTAIHLPRTLPGPGPAPDWHRNRNRKNINLPKTLAQAKLEGWRKLPWYESLAHYQGWKGLENTKFVSKDGHREAVYDGNGNLITSGPNIGTYNYYDPEQYPTDHVKYDVEPWRRWGN